MDHLAATDGAARGRRAEPRRPEPLEKEKTSRQAADQRRSPLRAADDVAPIANRVEGWLSEAQGRALFAAAAAASGSGAIVEIGSWKGRSTVWLAAGAAWQGLRIYAVDPHRGSREDPEAATYPAFRANLQRAGLLEAVEPLVMTSAEAVHLVAGPVELLFVDGDHSPGGAASDAALWLPRVMGGGTVMFHDVATSGYSGPRRVFQQQICRSPHYHRVRRVGSMAIAERTVRRSRSEAIRSWTFDLLLYRYDLEGAVKRVLRRLRGRRTT